MRRVVDPEPAPEDEGVAARDFQDAFGGGRGAWPGEALAEDGDPAGGRGADLECRLGGGLRGCFGCALCHGWCLRGTVRENICAGVLSRRMVMGASGRTD